MKIEKIKRKLRIERVLDEIEGKERIERKFNK